MCQGRFRWDMKKNYSLKGLWSTGTGCPGKWLIQMWCLGTWFRGRFGSARLMVVLDLKGLFQIKWLYDSKIFTQEAVGLWNSLLQYVQRVEWMRPWKKNSFRITEYISKSRSHKWLRAGKWLWQNIVYNSPIFIKFAIIFTCNSLGWEFSTCMCSSIWVPYRYLDATAK